MFMKTTFARINLVLLLFLIPILLLYSYSNKMNVSVVENTIQQSNTNQLSSFLRQLDDNVNQLSLFSIMLTRNPIIQMLPNLSYLDSFQQRQTKLMLEQMLILQSISGSWENRIAVYMPKTDEYYSSTGSRTLDKNNLGRIQSGGWNYVETSVEGQTTFVTYNAEPFSPSGNVENADIVIQVEFPVRNIMKMLDDFKHNGTGDPFLYHPGHKPILNGTSSPDTVQQLIETVGQEKITQNGNRIVVLNGQNYMVNVVKSNVLGWYLVDYLPLEAMLSPITLSRNLFYGSIAGLLIVSVIASLLLYRRVQMPITSLIRSVQQLKKGNYSARIHHKSNTEFKYLFEKFNEMAAEIQDLIENVLKEKIHSRDATLKQLQSQINPHFLYNCLFFINNMVRLGEDQAVTTMTLNLAEYFRYTTRLEKQLATVREEINLVVNYLSIQKLRMKQLQYEIEMPDLMMDVEIPRLLLQPIVENAIIHGIEEKENAGWIRIMGSHSETEMRISIEDDGIGMPEEQLNQLRRQLQLPLEQETGYALWNVQHRLMLQFSKNAGIEIDRSSAGGLKVALVWRVA